MARWQATATLQWLLMWTAVMMLSMLLCLLSSILMYALFYYIKIPQAAFERVVPFQFRSVLQQNY